GALLQVCRGEDEEPDRHFPARAHADEPECTQPAFGLYVQGSANERRGPVLPRFAQHQGEERSRERRWNEIVGHDGEKLAAPILGPQDHVARRRAATEDVETPTGLCMRSLVEAPAEPLEVASR